MSKRPGEEEYSVDEIIAEFKDTELKIPEEREADAPLFKVPGSSQIVEMPPQPTGKRRPSGNRRGKRLPRRRGWPWGRAA